MYTLLLLICFGEMALGSLVEMSTTNATWMNIPATTQDPIYDTPSPTVPNDDTPSPTLSDDDTYATTPSPTVNLPDDTTTPGPTLDAQETNSPTNADGGTGDDDISSTVSDQDFNVQDNYGTFDNTTYIVGLVTGILATLVLCMIVWWIYHKYVQKKHKLLQSTNETAIIKIKSVDSDEGGNTGNYDTFNNSPATNIEMVASPGSSDDGYFAEKKPINVPVVASINIPQPQSPQKLKSLSSDNELVVIDQVIKTDEGEADESVDTRSADHDDMYTPIAQVPTPGAEEEINGNDHEREESEELYHSDENNQVQTPRWED